MGSKFDLHFQVSELTCSTIIICRSILRVLLYKLYFSKNQGLHLIMDDVVESGPAWESGVRKGDVIVTVNDWLIVLMDRPQVSKILYSNLLKKSRDICSIGLETSISH